MFRINVEIFFGDCAIAFSRYVYQNTFLIEFEQLLVNMVRKAVLNERVEDALSFADLGLVELRLLFVAGVPYVEGHRRNAVSELEWVLLRLLPLVQVFPERLIFLDGVELIYHFINLVNSFFRILVDLFVMDIQHLTGVLRFIKVEVVESLHSLDDTWQINKSGQKHGVVQSETKQALLLFEANNLKWYLWLLRLLFLLVLIFFLVFLLLFRLLFLLRTLFLLQLLFHFFYYTFGAIFDHASE